MKALQGRRLVLPFALLVTATVAAGPACSTSNEVLAWEDGYDGGVVIPIDSGGQQPQGAVCGNGVREPGEACEDGNVIDGDGCSAKCVVETVVPTQCPGTAITLDTSNPDKRTGHVSGDTTGRPRSFDSPTCGGGNGTDIVYAITSDVQGQARVRLDAAFDALLYVRTVCTNAATEVSCKPVPVGGGRTDISFPMAKGQTSFVVVDGVAGKAGKFDLDVEIGATSCGDGLAQYPEQCDDGNTTAGDGCSPSCQLETPMAAAGKCPGASFTLVGNASTPVKMSFGGNIALLASTSVAFGCGGGSGADQVYAITPTTSGSITAELHASFDKALLHARSECFTSSTELDCREATSPSVPTRVTFPVAAQNTYFIYADADETPESGLYTLDVTLSPASCGNGVLETPETCDDGNKVGGDGCSDTCTLEPMPSGIDDCPGAPITFTPSTGNKVAFATSGGTASLNPGVKSCNNQADRKDAVYTFVAPFDGWLKAKAKGTFNLVLDLRTTCVPETGASAGSVACGNKLNGDDEETIAAAVTAGTTYYVVVDGGPYLTNLAGPYNIAIEMTPSVCGNGVIEGGEACDDGANAPGDGCAPDCKLEDPPSSGVTCTNPKLIQLAEDTPGQFSASVSGGNWNLANNGNFAAPCGATTGKEAYYQVTAPIDGVLVANVDATYNITPGVRTSCPHSGTTFLTCSNRSLGAGGERLALPVKTGTKYWLILEAPANQLGSFKMDLSIQAESCGDSVVSGNEQCDDGNLTSGDGCSATCTVEPLAGADTCPGYAVALAGTGSATRQKQLTISTTTLASNYSGTCGGNGRDGVVAVTSDIAGTLVAQLVSAWPATFYARSTCTNSATELDCEKADAAKPTDTLREVTTTVTPNVPVYLFIDGSAGASGPANLSLTVTP